MNSIRQIISDLFYRFRNLILYGIIGAFSAGVDFLIYYSLTYYFDTYYILANTVSVTFGITTSFILNRSLNFRVKDRVFKRFVLFISIGFGGLFLSSILLYYFIDVLHLGKIISKFVTIVIVAIFQYFLNKRLTFKKAQYG